MDDRDKFRIEFQTCWLCGVAWHWRGLHIHEIARGCHRPEGFEDRAAWLRLCGDCHDEVGAWSVVRQLAMKKVADPEWYDRVAVNEMRGRQPEAITEGDVDGAFDQILPLWQARYQTSPTGFYGAWG